MKLLTFALATVLSISVFAADSASVALTKKVALNYLDIAISSADGVVNKNLICDSSATYTTEITKATVTAMSYARETGDSVFAKKVITAITTNVALQKVVKTQVSYRYTLAATAGSANSYKNALIGSVIYGPAMGVLGNTTVISFGNATSAAITTTEMNDEGQISYKKRYITYSVALNSNYETIVTIEGKAYRMEQRQDGFMFVPAESQDSDDAYRNGFVEFASECEA